MLLVSATGIGTREKNLIYHTFTRRPPHPDNPCEKSMQGGISVPCPKCGSKHFLCYLSKEKAGITIFYCMAAGCGHEWVFGDMNPEISERETEP